MKNLLNWNGKTLDSIEKVKTTKTKGENNKSKSAYKKKRFKKLSRAINLSEILKPHLVLDCSSTF